MIICINIYFVYIINGYSIFIYYNLTIYTIYIYIRKLLGQCVGVGHDQEYIIKNDGGDGRVVECVKIGSSNFATNGEKW